MYKINFETPIHVHFIGIGGISMSGLAEILLKEGFTISGSDNKESALTDHLEQMGAKVFYGQKASNIIPGIDVVVYTAAIHPDNEEYAEAVRQKLPMLTRAELLGQLMTNYDMPIAISGTHGKTTTTSMLSHILLAGELDPTISVGGILKAIGGNIRVGDSEYFVTEACEYTNSFLHFFPKIGVILNIDEDHLDFFKDLADIRNSFHRFAKLLPKDGTLVIIILAFLHNAFGGRQCVYAWTIGLTLIPAIVTGLQTAEFSLGHIDTIFATMVPLHSLGMGWVCFTIAGFVIGFIWKSIFSSSSNGVTAK